MRVFVAGATGAVGRPLVHQLLAAGHDVAAVSRSPAAVDALSGLGVDAHVADALDAARLDDIVGRSRPEVMVHQLTTFPKGFGPVELARKGRQTIRLRREGTRLFMTLANRHAVRRVVAQSIAFGYRPPADASPEARPAVEGDPYYGRGRTLMDRFFRHLLDLEETVTGDGRVEGVALRYGGWYGPGTHFAPGGSLYQLAVKRRLPSVRGAAAPWNAVHVDDAASATVSALEGPTGVFNVTDGAPVPVNALVERFCDAVGAPPPRSVPRWASLALGFYPRHLMFRQRPVDNGRALRDFGWSPRYPRMDEALAAVNEW